MWDIAYSRDALGESTRCITSDLFAHGGSVATTLHGAIPDAFLFQALAPWEEASLGVLPAHALVGRLLQEFSCAYPAAQAAYGAARDATLRLGLQWPLAIAAPEAPDLIDGASEAASDEPVLVNGTFVLLAPDYSPEAVNLQFLVPQTVQEVLELLDTCRSRLYQELFPRLCQVSPQVDARWAVVLMIPEWIGGRVLVCIDLTLFDGRLLAVYLHSQVDRHTILNSVGLSGRAEVDVFVPGIEGPIDPGAEVELLTGYRISLVRAGAPPPPSVSLRSMLLSHLPWALGPAFPQDTADDRYCVVSDDFFCDFVLAAGRSPFLRTDVAVRLRLPPLRVTLTPATPQVEDAALYGRGCHNVVAVGNTSADSTREPDVIGLLDCRPVLEGWRRVRAQDSWLNVGLLRDSMSQGAPDGYVVQFSECPAFWDWLWIEPGQVVRVTYRPAVGPLQGPALRQAEPVYTMNDDRADGNAPSQQVSGPGGVPSEAASVPAPGAGLWGARQAGLKGRCGRHGRDVTRAAGFFQHACAPGILWFASVLLCLCPGGTAALCVLLCAGRLQGCHAIWAFAGLALVYCAGTHEAHAVQLRASLPLDSGQHRECDTPLSRAGRPVATPCRTRLSYDAHAGPAVARDFSAEVDTPGWDTAEHGLSAGLPPLLLEFGPTLLQESAGRADCTAFLNASTLLDVLFEHFGFADGDANLAVPVFDLQASTDPATQLSLDALLPARPDCCGGGGVGTEWFSLDDGQCAMPVTQEMWHDLTRFVPVGGIPALPACLREPERFRQWVLAGTPGGWPHDIRCLCVTSDGSYAPGTGAAGWGVVFSAVTP